MPTIAPWLQLPNFQAAAEAGARIGLQQKTAADDLALNRQKLAQEAADSVGRLRLGYSELGVSSQKAKAEQDLARATMALHAGRYSDLNSQAMDKLGLSRERLDSLEGNRDVVNGLNQDKLDALTKNRDAVLLLRERGLGALIDNRETVNGIRQAGLDETIANHDRMGDFRDRSLDATIDNRADLSDYRDRSLGERTANHERAAQMKGTPASKPFMVKIPIPADPQTGTPATILSLPSSHPAAQRYLKSVGMSERPPESQTGLLDSDFMRTGGETLPLPDSGTPITDPSPLPPEELASPTPAEPLAQKPSKRFKYDPATGKFEPQS